MIGPRALALACVNMIVGASIFVLPAAMAADLGPAAILAYGICAVILLLVLAPHLGLIILSLATVWSFSPLPDAYTLAHYGRVFGESSIYIKNTLIYAALAGLIDRWKNKGWTPDQVDAGEAEGYANGKGAKLYALYQARLRDLNACDFGDLLLHMLVILRSHRVFIRLRIEPRRSSTKLVRQNSHTLKYFRNIPLRFAWQEVSKWLPCLC